MPDPRQGVFETLLVRDGRIQALGGHLARLAASTEALYGQPLPAGLPDDARAHAAPLTGAHRLRIDAQPTNPGLAIHLTSTPADPSRPTTFACTPLTIPGGNGPHKWRDRAAIQPHTATVPLIVDADGTVLEAAWANVWLLDGDRLTTPPADGRLLRGVTRDRLMQIAPALGLTVVQRPVTLAEARAAPALMLTSSIALAATATATDAAAPLPHQHPTVAAIREALAGVGWDG